MMAGNIPPGGSVPVHSHPDDQSFYILSGSSEVLMPVKDGFKWIGIETGGSAHILPDVKHTWRNTTYTAVEILIATTPRLGEFFKKIGRPVITGKQLDPPTLEELEHFPKLAGEYKHWLAGLEENAAGGLICLAECKRVWIVQSDRI